MIGADYAAIPLAHFRNDLALHLVGQQRVDRQIPHKVGYLILLRGGSRSWLLGLLLHVIVVTSAH